MLPFIVSIFLLVFSPHTSKAKVYGKRYRTQRKYGNDITTESASFYNINKQDASAFVDQAISPKQRSLNIALNLFNSFNNGFYTFQIEQSCNCPICDTQSMNIYIEDNIPIASTYAESNEYALHNFCGGDEKLFNQRLLLSRVTIHDLFTIIQQSIINNINIEVTYHQDIGIPISISIQPLNSELNRLIAIHCIEFSTLFPRPNIIIRIASKLTILDFNTNNPHSCENIKVPDKCTNSVNDHFKCFRVTDGCNTCSCSTENLISCTHRICDEEIKTDISCMDITTAHNPITTTHNPITTTNSPITTTNNPITTTDNPTATTTNSPITTTTSINHINNITNITHINNDAVATSTNADDICVPHCDIYTDGCLQCDCNNNHEIPGECTLDPLCHYETKQCITCEDDNTMIYTQCGSADVTCDNINTIIQATQCIEKCECKPEFPIYDPINKKCIKSDQCSTNHYQAVHSPEPIKPTESTPHTTENINPTDAINPTESITQTEETVIGFGKCIQHCPVYYDGCNACQCPRIIAETEADFCTNLECSEGSIGGLSRTCFRCEVDIMEYVFCGKCDRTCNDPVPTCLDTDECVEKCQCPLFAPIYDNGRCITFQQCDIARYYDNSSSIGVNALEKQHEIRDNELHMSVQEETVSKYHYNWGEIIVYVIIVIICIIAGVSLLFWPRLIMKWRHYTYDDETINQLVEMDVNNKEDSINIDACSPLPLPDGTVVIESNLNVNNLP